MAQLANMSGAGVQLRPLPCFFCERIIVTVVLPDAIPKMPVRASDTKLLDPAVLIWWHSLAGQLATQPVVLVCEIDPAASTESSKSGCYTTKTTSYYKDVSGE
jgi:hypothetical protein